MQYQWHIESVGQEGMQCACSVLKCQNNYEFIHDIKNSNNMQGSVESVLIIWCLHARKLTKLPNNHEIDCNFYTFALGINKPCVWGGYVVCY